KGGVEAVGPVDGRPGEPLATADLERAEDDQARAARLDAVGARVDHAPAGDGVGDELAQLAVAAQLAPLPGEGPEASVGMRVAQHLVDLAGEVVLPHRAHR